MGRQAPTSEQSPLPGLRRVIVDTCLKVGGWYPLSRHALQNFVRISLRTGRPIISARLGISSMPGALFSKASLMARSTLYSSMGGNSIGSAQAKSSSRLISERSAGGGRGKNFLASSLAFSAFLQASIPSGRQRAGVKGQNGVSLFRTYFASFYTLATSLNVELTRSRCVLVSVLLISLFLALRIFLSRRLARIYRSDSRPSLLRYFYSRRRALRTRSH